MIKKKKICVKCNNEAYIWSKSMCKSCFIQNTVQKPIKKSYLSKKLSEKQIQKNIEKVERTKKLHQWFIDEIWNKRPHYSEVSLKWLGNEPNTCFFHHIYPKSSFPEYEFDVDNIVQLTADEHTEVEANPNKFHIVNELRNRLKIKYGQ